jgi:glutamyl-Q tRNA(Asp) synthetase
VNDANASTATATTATAEARRPYTGRFAPSPTGPLHLGSLATAAASYLDARHQGGRWLLRIEDLDTARTIPGMADLFLLTLERLGFCWDGPVVYQSKRLARYEQTLAQLAGRGLAYPCSCSRRDLGATDDAGGYPGSCRAGPLKAGPTARRFRIDAAPPPFRDRLQGEVTAEATAGGDPIIQRRDGLFAYQLAVVVDDAAQSVTDVVRGLDLLPSTSWQRSVQRALGVPEPRYAHLPLVCEPDGRKLAKSAHALSPRQAGSALVWRVLALLRQDPPAELVGAPLAELWGWATVHWRMEALAGLSQLPSG